MVRRAVFKIALTSTAATSEEYIIQTISPSHPTPLSPAAALHPGCGNSAAVNGSPARIRNPVYRAGIKTPFCRPSNNYETT